MRDYGKVFSRIWESADFRALSEDGRTLVMYLLTCQHGTIAGVFRIPDGYACEDLQWTPERVSKGFENVSAKGFATRCEATKWVWVTKFLEWNPPENPNQRKAAAKMAAAVPDGCGWKREFMRVCGQMLGAEQAPDAPPTENPSETLCEGLANQKQEQKQKQKQSSAKARQTPLPENFDISERVWAWSREKGYPVADVRKQFESFVSYVKRKGAKYVDWDEALRTAIRDDWAKVRGKSGGSDDWTGRAT